MQQNNKISYVRLKKSQIMELLMSVEMIHCGIPFKKEIAVFNKGKNLCINIIQLHFTWLYNILTQQIV